MMVQNIESEVYSYEQIIKYFNRINFFSQSASSSNGLPDPTFETLKLIAKCHTQSIPFGNLSFHYYHKLNRPQGNAPTHPLDQLSTQGVSIHHQDIFTKLVEEERDGCCFENNILAYWILKCLGFDCCLLSGKGVDYGLWQQNRTIHLSPLNHSNILINMDDEEYILDLGLHLGSTATPIKLELDTIQKSSDLTEHRIIRTPYPDELMKTKSKRYHPYVLEVRHAPIPGLKLNARNEWVPLHYFYPVPVYIEDVELLNNQLLLDSKNVFYKLNFMAINTPEGYCTYLNGVLKCFDANGSKTIVTSSFEERKQIFLKYFNTKLPENDEEYIEI